MRTGLSPTIRDSGACDELADGRKLGQALVELALLLPLLLMIGLGVLDFGRAMYAYVAVSSAAQAGAEYASRNPTATDSSVQNAVLKEAGSFLSSAPAGTVVVERAALTGGEVTMMQVTVTYTFKPITPIPSSVALPIKATAAAPVSAL